MKLSRNTDIMADAAYLILTSDSKKVTKNFFIDEDVLKDHGVTDFTKYKMDKNVKDSDLVLDLFV